MAFTLGFGETNGCLDLSLQDQVLTMVTHVELEFTINHYAREGGGVGLAKNSITSYNSGV